MTKFRRVGEISPRKIAMRFFDDTTASNFNAFSRKVLKLLAVASLGNQFSQSAPLGAASLSANLGYAQIRGVTKITKSDQNGHKKWPNLILKLARSR